MIKRSINQIILACKGFCMGVADIVPGVSGGTMALILGIYPALISSLKAFDLAWLGMLFSSPVQALKSPHVRFMITLVAGIITALLVFTKWIGLPDMMMSHPTEIYAIFFGLIVASTLLLIQQAGHITLGECCYLVAGVISGYVIVTLVPVQTPDALWFIALCGAIAICAMILPGISGSFLLLILGKYTVMLDAIATFNVAVLGSFIAGAIVGLMLFTRVLEALLRHYYRRTLWVIKGILIASLWVIWPFQKRDYDMVGGKERLVASEPFMPNAFNDSAIEALGLMVAAMGVVFVLHMLAGSKR